MDLDVLTCSGLSLSRTQGLTHLGKGTLTLCPYHSDRQLMSQVAVAGLLTVLVSFLDVKNSECHFCSCPMSYLITARLAPSLFFTFCFGGVVKIHLFTGKRCVDKWHTPCCFDV